MENHGSQIEDNRSIDIENPSIRLVTSIREMIDSLSPLSPDCCIYRVPERLRQLNEKAYTPQTVSVGPLHHGKSEYLAMEEQKLRYLQAFLHRTEVSLENYIRVIKEWEERVRNSYAENIKLGSDEFVKLILVDSSFIIEVILRCKFFNQENNTDYLSKPLIISSVLQDMILIENQLPFFVLEGLFNLAFPSHPNTLVELSFKCFEYALPMIYQLNSNSKVKHFVDLLRLCFLPSSLNSLRRETGEIVAIPTATNLQGVGLRFKSGTNKHLLDIRYAGEVLEIPKLCIGDELESLLRNLIAFEQWQYPYETYIFDYVIFMDNLMDTTKDADLLIQNGIIDNLLGDSSAVSTLFNNLTSDVFAHDYYNYHSICQDLNKYFNVPWHNWKATLKHDYFSTPWRIASTIAAIVLLTLTLIQTVYSIISS